MIKSLIDYLSQYHQQYFQYIIQHLNLSIQALVIAAILGLILGYIAFINAKIRALLLLLIQGLRVIPSIGILFILIPVIGSGHLPALIALVVLAMPPIAFNTLVGFQEVPNFYIEVGWAMGMTPSQVYRKIRWPLALPYIINGMKLSFIEIIASATLATYIGAGGLGTLIFTGLGLYRYELIVLGAGTVAGMIIVVMLLFDRFIGRFKSF